MTQEREDAKRMIADSLRSLYDQGGAGVAAEIASTIDEKAAAIGKDVRTHPHFSAYLDKVKTTYRDKLRGAFDVGAISGPTYAGYLEILRRVETPQGELEESVA